MRAAWIWTQKATVRQYNQTIFARKVIELKSCRQARLSITADSYYRVWINGHWVNDGPCRSWPEHYQYDDLEVSSYLVRGQNEIKILARYWGCGNFHTVPQQAGLLAELLVETEDGETLWVGTDTSWEAAEAKAWQVNTAKVSIQMEPQEVYDAGLEKDLRYGPAVALFDSNAGPWQDLHARDVELLTRQPVAFQSFLGANLISRSHKLHFCLLAATLNHPELVEANQNTTLIGGMATELILKAESIVTIEVSGLQVFVDGQNKIEGVYTLSAGAHFITAFVTEATGHNKEKQIWLSTDHETPTLTNPLSNSAKNPWCWMAFPEESFSTNDIRWPAFGLENELAYQLEDYFQKVEALGNSVINRETLRDALGDRAVVLDEDVMFAQDDHWRFLQRQVVANANQLVDRPVGLMYDTPQYTVVRPSPEGDVELVYDLGEQVIGFYDFEIEADAGAIVDIYSLEYITPEGTIQHSFGNRNGMRYICNKGWNRFTSTKRRSGRYVFITLRNFFNPIMFRKFRVISSTYPVEMQGSFRCSDQRLQRIWDISARTLKLCMEDTFTDCPLYEQTHWVGDARNESLFAYPVFGATDIGKRCIRLTAQSLERYPITGCQVPSSWDCLLPTWSFLWGISVSDYYNFSADRDFLREVWPAVMQNLRGAERLLDQNGLFSGPFWNMFDWTGIDDRHETVLHNSMLLMGAISAALSCGEVLGESESIRWLSQFGQTLRKNINRFWDDIKQAYPDSIHEDGSPSQSTSQHTSFLGLLYDIVDPHHQQAALRNMLNPPDEMVKVGSPFAIMYYYEALEKIGRSEDILKSIYESYLPMLAVDATTVWETFATSNANPSGFPTRSHAHAWSSAPVYFLNRIILGLRPAAPGGAVFEVSPWVEGLDWAEGSVATMKGRLKMTWRKETDKIFIKVSAPEQVELNLVQNASLNGLACHFTRLNSW
jgi:alpha-L-rhamnosidase